MIQRFHSINASHKEEEGGTLRTFGHRLLPPTGGGGGLENVDATLLRTTASPASQGFEVALMAVGCWMGGDLAKLE